MAEPREEWRVEVMCPHGHTIIAPISVLNSALARNQLDDPCRDAEAERAATPPVVKVQRWKVWLEVRRLRRALRSH